ncbi:pentapeptide repeat protein [Thalassoporum mexicanum PCC 7367]|uniref:pentapeptide repeat-containing protein n=1 Tax=Thalassoporum mexicanum TaxID=3457544 RepID=UPI00029FFF17|nr:pentapeptide repeat-containing protein [Pseudanabaena sp. PCC 7367]AFY71493.1 pentapeptide repeat protein [Pseudanabaena sp. PCC 7367]
MANDEQLALLLKGVDIWNGWRDDYPDEEISLMGADLSGANLTQANLNQVSLYNADLSGANLTQANLVGANLFNANLSDANLNQANLERGKLYNANLQNASLVGAELHGTNLTSAKLTGAWIEQWQINSDTKLDGIDCQYVYVGQDSERQGQRIPNDRDFEPGEFSDRFGVKFNFVVLSFGADINWRLVAKALKNLQEQHAEPQNQPIGIQSMAIENGSLNINLQVAGELDQTHIEKRFWQTYKMASNSTKRQPAQDLNGAIDRLVLLAEKV